MCQTGTCNHTGRRAKYDTWGKIDINSNSDPSSGAGGGQPTTPALLPQPALLRKLQHRVNPTYFLIRARIRSDSTTPPKKRTGTRSEHKRATGTTTGTMKGPLPTTAVRLYMDVFSLMFFRTQHPPTSGLSPPSRLSLSVQGAVNRTRQSAYCCTPNHTYVAV